MGERAEHDDVDPALEVVGDVAQFFAGVEAAVRLINETTPSRPDSPMPASKVRRVRSDGFSKNIDDLFSGERLAEICGTRLHHAGEMEKRFDLNRARSRIEIRSRPANFRRRACCGTGCGCSMSWLLNFDVLLCRLSVLAGGGCAAERTVERANDLIHVLLLDDVRRQETQHRFVRAIDQNSLLQ